MARSGFFESHDGLFHVHRLAALDRAIRAGVAYEFMLSDRWIMMPEVDVDFVDGEEAFVFGLVFGFGF